MSTAHGIIFLMIFGILLMAAGFHELEKRLDALGNKLGAIHASLQDLKR